MEVYSQTELDRTNSLFTSPFPTEVSSLLTNHSLITICVSSSDNEIDHRSIVVISAVSARRTLSAALALTERVLRRTQVTAQVMNIDVVQW